MKYVSHQCADIIHGVLKTRDDGTISTKTHMNMKPTINYYTPNLYVFRDESTKDDEAWYAPEVLNTHIHNKLKIDFISKHKFKHLDYLYSRFHHTILNIILVEFRDTQGLCYMYGWRRFQSWISLSLF